MAYPVASIGTIVTLAAALVAERIGTVVIDSRAASNQQRYAWRSNLRFITLLLAAILIAALWTRLFPNKGTFYGLLGAGLAVALREPLLSMAGRLSIWMGRMYRVGDRIEFKAWQGT